MSTGSLRLRLILAASIAISIALGLAGIASYYQFRTRVAKLTLDELNAHFEQLVSMIDFDNTGQITIDGTLSDPRFEKQFGGLYWQIEVPAKDAARSRSLWDQTLLVPTPPHTSAESHVHELSGPNGSTLFALEKIVSVEQPTGQPVVALITIGIDQSATSNAAAEFGTDIARGLGLLYLILMGSSVAQIFLGLRPLEAIRKGLQSIQNGNNQRMAKSFPSEVQPLVNEINTLLNSREHQLQQARHRASNLAHGLKTPLTVLEAIAGELDNHGSEGTSREIRETIVDMRRLVERELMRARASAGNSYARCKPAPVVNRIIRALSTIQRQPPVEWQNRIDITAELPIDLGDLTEVMGNLLENAHKHASTIIRVSNTSNSVVVEDDGIGVAQNLLRAIVKRGVKLDEMQSGSGLGLAIVHDMAEAYNADLKLDQSLLGGLRVSLIFKPQLAQS